MRPPRAGGEGERNAAGGEGRSWRILLRPYWAPSVGVRDSDHLAKVRPPSIALGRPLTRGRRCLRILRPRFGSGLFAFGRGHLGFRGLAGRGGFRLRGLCGVRPLGFTDHKGRLVWISAARPGRSSEITTARHDKITARLREAGLGAIGDLGFIGLDDDPDHSVIITGYKAARTKPLTKAKKQVNKLIAAERAACEHAFAHLKNWRVLTKLRLKARHATTLLRALLVLTNIEIAR